MSCLSGLLYHAINICLNLYECYNVFRIDCMFGDGKMKITVKKLGSALLALTMAASMASMTGCSGAAEKTETTTTAATSAGSEETKTTEETEKPVTETTKADEEPAKPVSEYAEKIAAYPVSGRGPYQTSRKIDAALGDDGVLTWKDMVPEKTDEDDDDSWISYYIYISGVCVEAVIPDKNDASKEFKLDLKKYVDSYIKAAKLERSENGKYEVLMIAELEYTDIYASWDGSFTYESKAKTAKKFGKLDANIDGEGNLTWKSYKGAIEYFIYINEYYCPILTEKRSIPLKKQIDFMIKCGFIKKADTYDIRMYGFDGPYDNVLAKWTTKFTYASDAVPGGVTGTVDGLSLKNGVLTWNTYAGADIYYVEVFLDGKFKDSYFAETNKSDVNDYIAQEIYEKDMDLNAAKFTFRVSAVELSSGDALGIFESERLVIATSLYGDYKIEKAPNPLTVTGKEATVSSSKLNKKNQTISRGKAFNGLSTGRGGFIFKKLSGDKNISINKSSGLITIKKGGLKKGQTYNVDVSVQAKGNVGYSASETFKVTITIKAV